LKEVKKKLESLGEKVLSDIEKKENPSIEVPIRSLSNIIYDKKTGMLTLGEKSAKRFLFHTGHAKRFMQTMLVAAFCKDLLEQSLHTSLRDLFYALKRTLPNSQENTFTDQSESICPDEPIIVRMNDELKIVPASEVVEFAEKKGNIIVDGKKKVISNINLYACAFDENQSIKEHKVNLVIKHPGNPVKKIKTSSGRSVKVTNSHNLFTISNGDLKEIKTSELKIGDWIALPRKINIKVNNNPINVIQKLIENAPEKILTKIYLKGTKETIKKILKKIGKEELKKITSRYKNVWSDVVANWVRLSTIPLFVIKKSNTSVDEFLGQLKVGCKGSSYRYKTLIEKDENFGTVLGYMLSEGCHTIFKGRNSAYVYLSNSNIKILKEFKKAFIKAFGEKCAGRINNKKDGTYGLNVGYDMLSYILTYAIGYKPLRAWKKEVPSCLLDAPENCVKAFLRSFRLGDGSSFVPKLRIRYHTSSQKLANGVVFLLLRLGIFPRIYRYKRVKKNHHDAFEIRINNREYVKILSRITGDFKEINLKRKHEISGDRIPFVGNLIEEARKSCKKKLSWERFCWEEIKNRESISRPTLLNIIKVLKSNGAEERYIKKLEQIANSDIYWDKIISIEEDKKPHYTVDLAVNPTQNFIGGNGFIILHNSDPIIVDLEVMLDVLREQLHLNADVRGRVVGDVVIKDRGDTIDWSKLGSGGWAIPSNVEDVEFKKVNADFILAIEKNAAFERLHEDKFWKKHKCILITTQGQAARGTRRLIQRLATEYNLPVYVFSDADSYGWYIYSVIKYGSMSLAHVSDRLGTPNAKFLGLTISDIDKFGLKDFTIKAEEVDIKRAKEMLNYEWFKHPAWQKELKLMIERKIKAELEALSGKGLKFITENYLPEKIEKKDFLP